MIETVGLTKQYPSVTALDHLDVTVGDGVTGLVGANGAGKSTLIKILLGLVPATGGTATVLGHDIATDGAAIRASVGYMPEHDCLPADVSASDFVVHMGQMSGLPYAAARERAADVLRHVGLAEERYRPMGGYSTGMKQRAKLAQALVHDPRLVLLDEPTNGLDPSSRDDMLALVQQGRARVRHRGAGDLAPARRARAGQRPRRRARRRRAAAVLGHHRVPARDRQPDRRGAWASPTRTGCWARRWSRPDSPLGPPGGALIEVEVRDEATPDVVRDLTVDLGLGLVRMQERHHRIEDVFREGGAGSVQPV